VGSRVGYALRQLFETMMLERLEERDQVLEMHAEHNRTLTALTGELAHELKNPLASVKGLAALVRRSAEGKAEERLGVLGREADRMQSILDELLNFSRPLVPLAMEPVDLHGLAVDVAELHEATALDRRVTLVVEGDAVPLTCDPRKIRQVLINLVQNALDASPPGGTVTVRVTERGRRAMVRVRDEGPGLSAEVADQLFEPGTTTKAGGSGLGLVVARSLARQHGGELLLANHAEGGCLAELTVPLEPAA
jgi:two-component system sensor histidine kinase HydH